MREKPEIELRVMRRNLRINPEVVVVRQRAAGGSYVVCIGDRPPSGGGGGGVWCCCCPIPLCHAVARNQLLLQLGLCRRRSHRLLHPAAGRHHAAVTHPAPIVVAHAAVAEEAEYISSVPDQFDHKEADGGQTDKLHLVR
jgi:hypothetical protein